jgi:hypothetical protein
MATNEQVTNEQAAETNNEMEEGVVKNSRKGVTAEDRKVYANLDEARKGRPQGKEAWFLYGATRPDGQKRFTWAPYAEKALYQIMIGHEKYQIEWVEDLPTVDDAEAVVNALPDEAREAFIAKLLAGKKAKK